MNCYTNQLQTYEKIRNFNDFQADYDLEIQVIYNDEINNACFASDGFSGIGSQYGRPKSEHPTDIKNG
jgi:hypothetical protein